MANDQTEAAKKRYNVKLDRINKILLIPIYTYTFSTKLINYNVPYHNYVQLP